MEPATNIEVSGALDKEIRQAAALYADSLLPLADRWQKAVENDIYQIFTTEPPHTHFNKDRQKRYSLTVDYFVSAVKRALKSHGFDITQLDRVTQWWLGEIGRGTQIQDGLSRDEAHRLFHSMNKQGFRAHCIRELCSNLYTVLAYKDGASQTMPTDTPPTAGQTGEAKTPFATDISEPGLREIFLDLQGKGYIAPTSTSDEWLAVFGKVAFPAIFNRIMWTAKNTITREPNKSSLLDLLEIMGIDEATIRSRVNTLFHTDGLKKFGSNDFNKFFINGRGREHHATLQAIITQAIITKEK